MIATDAYQLLKQSVGLVDRSGRAMLRLAGADAVDFLQGQVTNDVERLTPGTGCYAAILTPKGKLRADLRILRGDDSLWIDGEAPGTAPLRHTVETYTLGREVSWEDMSDRRSILSLVGPGADAALEQAPPPEEHAFVEGDHGVYVRTDLGIDVICADGEAVRAALEVEEAPLEAAECVRIESGRPRLGLDMDGDTIPEEAGLNARAVSFSKGCYVGQETVARLHYKGKPNRHLRGLRLSAPASHADEIRLGERVVGHVGSACVSPTLGPIALAVVRREAAPGDELLVNGAAARVVELPFANG